MIYLAWVGLYEGPTDASYYDVLLPRVMEEITRAEGTRAVVVPQAPAMRLDVGREVDRVSHELCYNAASFNLIFVHADTGGRSLEAGMDGRGTAYCRAVRERCDWPSDRCVILKPRREMEAWALADPEAVTAALGVTGAPSRYDLPTSAAGAENLPDPKRVLERVTLKIRGRRARRGGSDLLPLIAQAQTLTALRGSRSFRAFETDLRRALRSLGYLP